MPTIALTDRYIHAIKGVPNQRLEIFDQNCPGLHLRVTGTTKSWAMRYRAADGRHARHRLGEFPTVNLRTARLEAGRLREMIGHGGDPVRERQLIKEQARLEALDTFGKLLAAYWVACETGEWQPKRKRKRATTLKYEKRLSERHIEPVLSNQPLASIKRSTIKALLRDMTAKGIGAQTNRVQALIRQVFNFGVGEELVEINPAMGFAALHSAKPRRRVWKDPELRLLWKALAGHTPLRTPQGDSVYVSRPVRIALQLALLLLQRRTEIAGMDLAELDLDQAVWLIPAERMKSDRPHQVPLPPYAVTLIREAIALTKLPSDRLKGPVFPHQRDYTEPMRADAMTRAMDRLRDCIGVEDATVHDLRRTGSTALTSERLGVSPFIRSKVLGHGTDAGGGAQVSSTHYDANEYMVDKRAALRAWEALLLRIVEHGPSATKPSTHVGIIRSSMFGLMAANDAEPVVLAQEH